MKLLAIGKQTEAGIEVRVHPTFVRQGHPLAAVNDSFNAVYLTGDSVGDVMLYGRGAGALPTGSAIVADSIYAATHSENKYSTFKNTAGADKDTKFISDFKSAYYLRIMVEDRAGILAKIAAIFGRNNVSIVEMIQKPIGTDGRVPLVLITHETRELAVRSAVAKINALEGVGHVETVLRVIS